MALGLPHELTGIQRFQSSSLQNPDVEHKQRKEHKPHEIALEIWNKHEQTANGNQKFKFVHKSLTLEAAEFIKPRLARYKLGPLRAALFIWKWSKAGTSK